MGEKFKKLKEENMKCKVLLVGDGLDTPKYKKMVEEKQLEEYIVFLGPNSIINACFLYC